MIADTESFMVLWMFEALEQEAEVVMSGFDISKCAAGSTFCEESKKGSSANIF